MSNSRVVVDPASISARSRRSSVSAIPRPVSGTSRQATPALSRAGRRDSPAESAPLENAHAYRKSWQPSGGRAPSSFRKSSLQVPPQTRYSAPYNQRSQQDLSGTQQQLYIRNMSTHSLNVPDVGTAPHLLKQASSSNALPKSKTMSSLLSPSRDSMPGRRLMQPIGPPLPRTQTLGNISCFSQSSSSPSPRKSKTVSLSPPRQNHSNTSQVNIAEVLSESRMTEQEMDSMRQVQREAAANRVRLRSSHHQYRFSHQSASGPSSRSIDPTTLNLLPNDGATTQHLEGVKRKSSSGRLLFINPALANKNWQQNEPPTTTTTISIGSMTSSEPSRGEEIDPRNMHVAEPTAYWTGRYISLCDRLCMKELNKSPQSPSESSEKQIDRLFESNERARINSALTELRDHCKTAEALRSFEEFEGSLLRRLGVSRQSLHRAGALADSKEPDKGLTASQTMPLNKSISNTPGTSSSPVSQMSSLNAGAVGIGALKSFYGEGTIAKSKTTGNLSSLIPIIPKRRHFVIGSLPPNPSTSQPDGHRRKTSYFDCSPETRAKAMKEREQRAARRAAETHRRSTSHALSSDGPASYQFSSNTSSTVEQARPQPISYNSREGESDAVSFSLSATALESGHGRPPPPASIMTAPSRVELVSVSSGGKEKVIKSWRKPERQFSGDRVKSLLGAGVREVKKMGRRVSGMSWPGSGEE